MSDRKKKHRILFISHSARLTGAPVSLFHIVENIDRDKYETVTVFPGKSSAFEAWESSGLPVKVIENPEIGFSQISLFKFPWLIIMRLMYFFHLFFYIIRGRFDVIYVNSGVNILSGLAPAVLHRKVVWHLHETFDPGFKNKFKCYMIGILSDYIILASPTSKSLLKSVTEKKSLVVFNGINLEKFENAVYNTKLFKEFNIQRDWRVVIFTGNICHIKGLDILADAARIIADEMPKVVFLLVGDTPADSEEYAKRLIKKIQLLRIEDNFKFLGFRKDIHELLKISDAFVLPSRTEACPISLIEAMAAGCPIVSSHVGCVEDLLDFGKSGIIVPKEDPEKLAEAILLLLKDKDKCQRFSENAMLRSKELFTINGFVKSIESVFEKVI